MLKLKTLEKKLTVLDFMSVSCNHQYQHKIFL